MAGFRAIRFAMAACALNWGVARADVLNIENRFLPFGVEENGGRIGESVLVNKLTGRRVPRGA